VCVCVSVCVCVLRGETGVVLVYGGRAALGRRMKAAWKKRKPHVGLRMASVSGEYVCVCVCVCVCVAW